MQQSTNLTLSDSRPALSGILRPKSVAVLGASDDMSKPGGRCVANLLASQSPIQVFPVNPRYEKLCGLDCYPSIEQVPQTVDLVIFAVPADHIIASLQACAAAKIKNVIIFTAGFAETGEQGLANQKKLVEIARDNEINILGPNCAGLFHIAGRTALCFSPYFEPDTWRPGKIALLVQGGGLGAAVWDGQDRGVGFSWFVTLGNEAVLDSSDFIDAMADDEDTEVIALILEGVKKGDAFRRAVRKAHAKNKVVIAMHQGRTDEGRRAAALHTGVLATSDLVTASVLAELGVPRAIDLDELYHLGAIFSRYGRPQGDGVCIVSISGGAGALCADLAAHYGMSVPQPSSEATAELKKIMVSYASAANPLDLTTAVYRTPEMIYSAIKLALDDPAYAAVVVPVPFYYPGIIDNVCIQIARAASESAKPVIVAWLAQGTDKPARMMLERAGVCVVSGADLCMRVLSRYVTFNPPGPSITAEPVAETDPTVMLRSGDATILQEDVAKSLLAKYGLRVPQEQLVKKRDDIRSAIEGLRAPLAMKVISSEIIHKAQIGGVKLNVSGADEAEAAFAEISENVAKAAPKATVDGILVQEMADGLELMLGARIDPIWGPVVLVGAGGNLAEVIEDVAIHSAPLDESAARKLLHSTRIHKAMQQLGYLEDGEVVAAIVALSRFVAHHREEIATIDANPLIVAKDGAALLVDAVIELSDAR